MNAPAPSGAASLSFDAKCRIANACERFDRSWSGGQNPHVEDFLDPDSPAAERRELLKALLAVEFYYRRKAGQSLEISEYLRRFPDHVSLIALMLGQPPAVAPTPPTPSSDATATEVPPSDVESSLPRPPVPRRYALKKLLGQGGMGDVWLARDRRRRRLVAVKVVQERWAGNANVVCRFVEEAQLTSQLQHPGIPPLYERGDLPDGRPYFCMKVVHGRTLASLLETRANPGDELPRLLSVFEQVCQAVAYAHSKGVIHRDLKPANVMVGAFGEVQLMDWGLAKVLNTVPAARAETA
jgi:serine/threonine protein kinase